MKTQFTPGPWTVNHCDKTKSIVNTKLQVICTLIFSWTSKSRLDEAEANAALIAAAPEMYEELEKANRIIRNMLNLMTTNQKIKLSAKNEKDGLKDGLAVVRADAREIVLAKARGKS